MSISKAKGLKGFAYATKIYLTLRFLIRIRIQAEGLLLLLYLTAIEETPVGASQNFV